VRRKALPAAALLLFLASRPAQAHLVTTGLGPFYDGAAHLAKSPGDLAILVALTLLGAMRGAAIGRAFLALLPLAWLAGGEIGLAFSSSVTLDWISALSFLLAGALVAADRNLSLIEVGPLCVVIGAFQGYLTGSALSETASGHLELLGSVAALLIVVTLVAGVVVSIRVYWARIVVRVLGSWIAATGLLMLGWTLRGAR
jgi:hydrogenase/urease accessory protein HupE